MDKHAILRRIRQRRFNNRAKTALEALIGTSEANNNTTTGQEHLWLQLVIVEWRDTHLYILSMPRRKGREKIKKKCTQSPTQVSQQGHMDVANNFCEEYIGFLRKTE
ncbi:hypothetical protein JHK86_003321 [Glycine max]|nr:hypothetical protein JHK86_003321 [Glycine max]